MRPHPRTRLLPREGERRSQIEPGELSASSQVRKGDGGLVSRAERSPSGGPHALLQRPIYGKVRFKGREVKEIKSSPITRITRVPPPGSERAAAPVKRCGSFVCPGRDSNPPGSRLRNLSPGRRVLPCVAESVQVRNLQVLRDSPTTPSIPLFGSVSIRCHQPVTRTHRPAYLGSGRRAASL
jgi:hypothetical protein